MNTTEKKPICLEQDWDKYVKDAERLVCLKKLVYVASRRVETYKAYKRTAKNPFFSSGELDSQIARYERVFQYLRHRAQTTAINIITTI